MFWLPINESVFTMFGLYQIEVNFVDKKLAEGYNLSMENETLNEIEELSDISLEEEGEIDLSTIVSSQNYDWINDETVVVIVKSDKSEMSDKLSSVLVCGKPMVEWVKMATSGPVQKVIKEPSDDQFLNMLKGYGAGKKYLALFYSDTPLLERSTFCEIMDYFAKNRYNIVELPRGYVFSVDYLMTIDVLFSPVKKSFNARQFEQINTPKALSSASKVLQAKILDYHKENGVTLLGESTIFIDADVEIEEGTVIYPNNILKGQTYIGKNVTLDCGNIISDSIVADDCMVVGSYIIKSKIKKGQTVGPFAKIDGEIVGD